MAVDPCPANWAGSAKGNPIGSDGITGDECQLLSPPTQNQFFSISPLYESPVVDAHSQ